jgi:hypothetical protein
MPDALQTRLRRRPGTQPRWRTRAFGVDFELSFASPIFAPTTDHGSGGATTLDLVYADSIRQSWPADGARRTGLMGPEDKPVMTVHEHQRTGYLIRLVPYGIYLVSADGTAVACAPPAVAWWYWQRLLVGQVLPAVATLRGAEILHASAIALDGHAIAFAGDPGLGKSSLAVQLMLRGARLVSEDALAITASDGKVMVAPGAGLLNLRETERELVGDASLGELGEIVGHSHGKVHAVVPVERADLPLGVLYLLERDDGSRPVFERVASPTFADFFRNAFVVYVLRKQRMINQLDLAARLAASVPVVRLRIQPGMPSSALAALVEEHARGLVAASEPA